MEKQLEQKGGEKGEKTDFESCGYIVMLLRAWGSNSGERQ